MNWLTATFRGIATVAYNENTTRHQEISGMGYHQAITAARAGAPAKQQIRFIFSWRI